jgi:GAF domain-containing protein
MSVPIKLRERVIGSMNINLPEDKELDQDESDITQALAQRIGIAIETATLLEETRRAAVKEQIIGDITGKIGSSINLRNVLQTAVEELGSAIPGSEIVIQLQSKEDGDKYSLKV